MASRWFGFFLPPFAVFRLVARSTNSSLTSLTSHSTHVDLDVRWTCSGSSVKAILHAPRFSCQTDSCSQLTRSAGLRTSFRTLFRICDSAMWDLAECHGCWPFFGLLSSLLWSLMPTAVIIPIADDSIPRSTASLIRPHWSTSCVESTSKRTLCN